MTGGSDTVPLAVLRTTPISMRMSKSDPPPDADIPTTTTAPTPPEAPPRLPKEIGGPPGPEPTRYGDWQYNGRCTDF